LQIDFL